MTHLLGSDKMHKPKIPPKPHYLPQRVSLPKPPHNIVHEPASTVLKDQHDVAPPKSKIAVLSSSIIKPGNCAEPTLNTIEISEQIENSATKEFRQRPLPLVPKDDKELAVHPWYRPVDRKKGEELILNGLDGCFLVRPSSKIQHCHTLTLWFRGRTYNIPIRRREDGLYSLGTPKDAEQCFVSVEEMINHYHREELVLYSNGIETGRTTLTIYPSK